MVCGLAVLLAGAADLAACVPKAGACIRAAFALAVQTSLALAGALFRGAAEVLNAYVAFFSAGGLSAIDAVFFFLCGLGLCGCNQKTYGQAGVEQGGWQFLAAYCGRLMGCCGHSVAFWLHSSRVSGGVCIVPPRNLSMAFFCSGCLYSAKRGWRLAGVVVIIMRPCMVQGARRYPSSLRRK